MLLQPLTVIRTIPYVVAHPRQHRRHRRHNALPCLLSPLFTCYLLVMTCPTTLSISRRVNVFHISGVLCWLIAAHRLLATEHSQRPLLLLRSSRLFYFFFYKSLDLQHQQRDAKVVPIPLEINCYNWQKKKKNKVAKMLKLSRVSRSSRYTPIVGCAFLVETLYGSKYSANLGAYNMPYIYVKTILLCATGHGLELREGRYIHGLIELLLPSKVSQDNLTKLELLQFVDAIPMDRFLEGREADTEEEAEVQATMAIMSGSSSADPPPARQRAYAYHQHPQRSGSSLHSRSDNTRNEEGKGESAAAAAQRRRQQELDEEEEEDVAAVESIMSFVSPATFPSSMARVLVYDAVCTCVADGLYSAKEKERVALVSSHIGLSTAVRGQIEKLALQEKVLSIRKRRLLRLQQPPVTHVPQEEERLRQVAEMLSHTERDRDDNDDDDDDGGHDAGDDGAQQRRRATSSFLPLGGSAAQTLINEATASAAAARHTVGRSAAGKTTAEVEEARRVEAAKTLLRRARRRQEQQKYFAAGE